ncbi:hypothetical protein ACJRO7_004570 [Eucalyptus globulus]|uniref:Copper transporter n=1 Tax=Eucalyptus globulus TaxID=34317 RepID=A0ABD3IX55_EUCGL
MRQEELRTHARNLMASIHVVWRRFLEVACLHVVVLRCMLVITSLSKLQCSDAWMAVTLVLMAAGFYLVRFVMLMLRLMRRYVELEAVEGQLRRPLADVEGGGRRGGHGRRALYATLAVGYFILLTLAVARHSWSMACPDR